MSTKLSLQNFVLNKVKVIINVMKIIFKSLVLTQISISVVLLQPVLKLPRYQYCS